MPAVSALPASTRPSGAGSTESSRPSARLAILLALLGLGAMATALLGPLALGWIDYHVSSGAADQLRGGDVGAGAGRPGGAGRRLTGRDRPTRRRRAGTRPGVVRAVCTPSSRSPATWLATTATGSAVLRPSTQFDDVLNPDARDSCAPRQSRPGRARELSWQPRGARSVAMGRRHSQSRTHSRCPVRSPVKTLARLHVPLPARDEVGQEGHRTGGCLAATSVVRRMPGRRARCARPSARGWRRPLGIHSGRTRQPTRSQPRRGRWLPSWASSRLR